jgi:hypothetical protein
VDHAGDAASEAGTGGRSGPAGPVPGRLLDDPAVEAAIEAFVASAPPLPEDTRARLARLLRTDSCRAGEVDAA